MNYLYDINSALGLRELFVALIWPLRVEAKIETLHIVAHSMGNLLLLEAFSSITKTPSSPALSES